MPIRHPAVTHGGTIMVTLFCAFLAYKADVIGSVEGDQSARLAVAFDRIATLENALAAKDREIAGLRADIFTLKLNNSINPLRTLFDYMDGIEQPAWIKRYRPEKNDFVMMHINPAYEQEYGVTNAFYAGKTDQEVHGERLGDRFLTFDLRVVGRRDFEASVEGVVVNGERQVIGVWKWYVPLPGGGIGVAGIQHYDCDDRNCPDPEGWLNE